LGTIQATEAIKYLAGFEEGLITDRLLVYDAKVMTFHSVAVKKDPNCAACGAAKQAAAAARINA
jgi:adenylyltransferase/sulfurtransferase